MYLKSLVLKGFKSFADRSVLGLEPGITAIVGPNGSGKSNISDAVLWVLGERNAKNLRGQAMEDVIFAGSSARKSVGLAEVDLVLDNADGTLPIDYAEVVITRRMYRSGESEYLINGTQARRMDVLDILHDSGLGTGTHSIISQGNLDSILQSKPEDRRALIEEAAGVLKHKQRKAKSARKLERMDAHLTRVKDVAGEIERQLAPLARKAKRAKTYQELSAQLSEMTVSLAVDDLRGLQRAWNAAARQESALEEQLGQRKAEIASCEAESERVQELIRKQTMDAGELSRQYQRAMSAVERFDSAVLLLHEKRRSAQSYAADVEVGLEADKARRTQLVADCEDASAQLKQLITQKDEADKKVSALSEEHAGLTGRHRQIDTEVASLEKQRREAQTERERAQRTLERTREELAAGMAHAKLVEARREELDTQLARATKLANEKKAAADTSRAELESLLSAEQQARKTAGEAVAAREEARRARDAARDSVSVTTSQIKGLEELERTTDAGAARTWLLDNAGALAGAPSALSHALRVEEGYEGLVERLLQSDIAALLVDRSADALALSDALSKAQVAGRVVLVPRHADVSAPCAVDAARVCGGRALLEALSYPPEATDAVRALFGAVVVCDSLTEALDAQANDTFGACFATRSGEFVSAAGKVTLDSAVFDAQQSVLARARQLDELRSQLTQQEEALRSQEQAVQQAERLQHEAQAESMKLTQRLATARGVSSAAEKESEAADRALASLRQERESIERQHEQAARAVSEARPSVESLESQIAQLASAIEEAQGSIAELQDSLTPLRKQAAVARDNLAEAKLLAATLAERTTYTSRMVEARRRELELLDRSHVESRKTLKVKQVAQARAVPLLALMEELAESARRRAGKLEQRASAAQDSSSGLHAQANEARERARKAHEAFDEANAQMSQVRVDKGRLEVQVDAAVKAIVEDCGVALETALQAPELEDRTALESEAFKLRRRIANMGTINPDAAQEYDDLKARYDYLASQIEDLDMARKSLVRIVRVIDARMKDDFVRTFEAVDSNFREIFGILFPGGHAQLSLVDPDDLENTGVEVSAQPRGKRITKMMLMSGGEKSLTALALLFAVYRTRSTPFYILDEVEAALDDSNLRRLIAYLQSLRGSTQLIMITHQRRTMEMADVLFGVSMQSDGVTKVISQRLENALQHAE